ncbi:MAG: GreA/GreB family elongation factor, partial [Verrucomicrobia bacterium]|nr:GreA/GreB family elongation factor [Verrucomicrobiota bacterium]
DLAFAAESLRPIPRDHILARKASDLDQLRHIAGAQHLELVKLVLNSYGGKATVEQIQQVLVPDVIRDDWKKWWEAARRELKKDGHFQVRDDIRQEAGLPPVEGEITAQTIWEQDAKLGSLLELLPGSKHRRALETFKAANPEHWAEALELALNRVSAKLCHELAGLLIHEGKMGQLKETVARLVSQHSASSELLLWLAKDRNDSFADILGPEVFRAMLTAMERDQFNERRSNRLRDFILDDQQLLVELIGSADFEVIKDLTRALQLSPSFDDMDKRSLLARIVKSYPAIQVLISGEQTRQEATLLVSWPSLERRKEEYRELVEKKIPANSKEIAVARSYGDLSENHEYKAAKEMQKLLMRRKADLETQLVRARGTDFSGASTDVAGIGTVVHAIDLATSQPEQFTILGAWDSDPEKDIISYLSPVAQSLLNHKVGDEVEVEVHGVRHHHRIKAIRPYIAPADPAPAEPAA